MCSAAAVKLPPWPERLRVDAGVDGVRADARHKGDAKPLRPGRQLHPARERTRIGGIITRKDLMRGLQILG
jgi:hypothetical protein